MECLRMGEDSSHALKDDNPKVLGETGFSLKTLGIFDEAHVEVFPNTGYVAAAHDECYPNGIKKIWGLTRSSEWILLTINYLGLDDDRHHLGRKGYEKAQTVEFSKTDIQTIVSLNGGAWSIWAKLGDVIEEWAERREFLYKESLKLAEIVKFEKHMLSITPNK